MGCQSSKQSGNEKTRKSKLSKFEANENANASPNIRSVNNFDCQEENPYNKKRLSDSVIEKN